MSEKFTLNITIPLAPVAQKRPRFLRSSFRVYDPSAKDKKPFIKFFQENILDCFQNYDQNYKQNYKQIYKENNLLKIKSKNVEFLTKNNQKISEFFPIKDPLKMDIIFNFARPKSHFLRSDNISDRFKNNYPFQDIDNIIKFLLDCLQPQKKNNSYIGLIKDDKQVVNISACKKYLNNRDLDPFINLTIYN